MLRMSREICWVERGRGSGDLVFAVEHSCHQRGYCSRCRCRAVVTDESAAAGSFVPPTNLPSLVVALESTVVTI